MLFRSFETFSQMKKQLGQLGKWLETAAAHATFDVWSASLQADGEWSEARRIPEPVSDATRDEWSPSVTQKRPVHLRIPSGLGGRTRQSSSGSLSDP